MYIIVFLTPPWIPQTGRSFKNQFHKVIANIFRDGKYLGKFTLASDFQTFFFSYLGSFFDTSDTWDPFKFLSILGPRLPGLPWILPGMVPGIPRILHIIVPGIPRIYKSRALDTSDYTWTHTLDTSDRLKWPWDTSNFTMGHTLDPSDSKKVIPWIPRILPPEEVSNIKYH